MDNRFAYMRKHLGFSQKDASRIFSTRLDTIKKWDSGKLLVPSSVLDSLADYIVSTNALIDYYCSEREAENQEEPIIEIYLKTFSLDGLLANGLPPSLGWQDHVIGAIIGLLDPIHVYGADTLPESYESDFHWYEHWKVKPKDFVTKKFVVKDEALFAKELKEAVETGQWQVWNDPIAKHYHVGFRTEAVSDVPHVIWIKVAPSNIVGSSNPFLEPTPLEYLEFDDDCTPYIKRNNRAKAPVGLSTGYGDNEIDVHSLAEMIFSALRASFPDEDAMRIACDAKSIEKKV